MAWSIALWDGDVESEVQSDGRCVTRITRTYQAVTDDPNLVTEFDAFEAVGIQRGSPLPEYPQALALKGKCVRGPEKTRPPFQSFLVTYNYSTQCPSPETVDDDPTTMRTKWSIAPQIQSRYVFKDKNGKLIVNTAGQPFDGGIPVDVRLGSVTAKKNRDAAGYDKDSVLANSGKLNSETFLGGAPGTVQVDISAEEVYEGSYHYWSETYTFSYDPLGWQPKPANAGFFQRAAIDSDTLVRIINSDVGDTADPDSPVQEPEPLDDDGILVPIASRPDSCIFVEVEYFDEMDFAEFNL